MAPAGDQDDDLQAEDVHEAGRLHPARSSADGGLPPPCRHGRETNRPSAQDPDGLGWEIVGVVHAAAFVLRAILSRTRAATSSLLEQPTRSASSFAAISSARAASRSRSNATPAATSSALSRNRPACTASTAQRSRSEGSVTSMVIRQGQARLAEFRTVDERPCSRQGIPAASDALNATNRHRPPA